jgi:hypothetical protein
MSKRQLALYSLVMVLVLGNGNGMGIDIICTSYFNKKII